MQDVEIKAEIGRRLAAKQLPHGPGVLIHGGRGGRGRVCDACGERIELDDDQYEVGCASADRLHTRAYMMHLDCHLYWTALSDTRWASLSRADTNGRRSAKK